MNKRQIALAQARVFGYHLDSARFTRLRIESRVAIAYLREQWIAGIEAKRQGVKCNCVDCTAERVNAYANAKIDGDTRARYAGRADHDLDTAGGRLTPGT